MEQSTNAYLTINQVVKSFMNERNEQTLTNYERYLQICIEGYSDIQMFNINSVEVAYLSVDPDTKVAKLPVDYISLSKIAVNVCGQLWTLTLNEDMTPRRPESICPNPIETCSECDSASLGGYYFTPFWNNGYLQTALYSLGGGFNHTYYKIDTANRLIMFQGCVPTTEVILEYISTGVKAGGTPIPRAASQALKAYMQYALIRNDYRFSETQIQGAERRYNIELNALRRLEFSFTAEQFLDQFWAATSQGAKR